YTRLHCRVQVKPPLQFMPSATFDNVADGNQLTTNRDLSPMGDRRPNLPQESPGILAQACRGKGFVTAGQEERLGAQFSLLPAINGEGVMKKRRTKPVSCRAVAGVEEGPRICDDRSFAPVQAESEIVVV